MGTGDLDLVLGLTIFQKVYYLKLFNVKGTSNLDTLDDTDMEKDYWDKENELLNNDEDLNLDLIADDPLEEDNVQQRQTPEGQVSRIAINLTLYLTKTLEGQFGACGGDPGRPQLHGSGSGRQPRWRLRN